MKTKEKADFLFYADLDECRDQLSTRRPVKHQESAIYKLNDWFKSKEFPAGTIMVLPTGSGKTFTAVRFLCQKPLSDGYKVLWLAHTHHLLEQAFYSFIPKDKTKGGYEVGFIQNKDDIKIRVVSGASNNFNVNQIKKTDDIIIATLQTITNAYKKNHPQLEEFLKSADGKLIVVFDEAHHAPAPTYRKLLIGDNSDDVRESLRERFPEIRILGLTATPTYNDEEKKGWLKEIFPQEIIYQAPIDGLILEKILAKPKITESKTHIEQELDERQYQRLVRDYEKDIPQKMIKTLAANKNRNQHIVDTYVNNKDKYNKTIIFADRFEQCEYLNKLLLDKNIRSDVMYSATGRQKANTEALDKFRNNEIDVIINIKMLTEGTDVPDVDSIFLTRQTTSEILLTQMVGRALRGPKFGGSEDANLVFFIDNWKQQINWAIWDSEKWGAGRAIADETTVSPPWDLISVKLVQDLIEKLGSGETITGSFNKSMPIGWYQVDFFRSNESRKSDGSDGKTKELIMVFEDNAKGYELLIEYLKDKNFEKFDDESIRLKDCAEEVNIWNQKFFQPENEQIDRDILRNIFRIALHIGQDKDNNPPKFIKFEERDKYDLDNIVKEYVEADYGPRTVDTKLRSLYDNPEQIWSTLYYNYDLFKSQYNSCVEWYLNGENNGKGIASEEERLVKILQNGTLQEKINACNSLAELAIEEEIHDSIFNLLQKIADENKGHELGFAAENAVKKILSQELTEEDKDRIKRRDGYLCLCCGEYSKRKLQVDHINPSYYKMDNSDDNLQTLCNKCNGLKGTETIDFRVNKTPLKESPTNLSFAKDLEFAEIKGIIDPGWWEKLLRRKINFFYHCGAVKTLRVDATGENFNFQYELHEGNPSEWILPHLQKMTISIQKTQKNLLESIPQPIISIEESKSDYLIRTNDAVIVAAKFALDEYFKHSVYMCQPNRAFRPVDYLGFYSHGKIDKHIPRILGKVEKVLLSKRGINNVEVDEKTRNELLNLLKSLEVKGSKNRIGYYHKVFFLSAPNSEQTITLENDIINDNKTKTGKTAAFTQNQRYVSSVKLKNNPEKTSKII
jgi:superfamily II DNA or RNA helicase